MKSLDIYSLVTCLAELHDTRTGMDKSEMQISLYLLPRCKKAQSKTGKVIMRSKKVLYFFVNAGYKDPTTRGRP